MRGIKDQLESRKGASLIYATPTVGTELECFRFSHPGAQALLAVWSEKSHVTSAGLWVCLAIWFLGVDDLEPHPEAGGVDV